MAMKKIQKAFYLSSEYVKNFIESRIEDISIKTQRSSSYIIENLLLDGLLPENEEAKSIVRNHLYPDSERGGVQKTLEAIFAYNAAGANWNSKHDNFKPLVDYCLVFGTPSATYNGKGTVLPHFYSQLSDVVDRIENCANSCIEPYDRKRYEAKAEWAKSLYKTSQENPNEIVIRNHFELVRDCWEMLDNWSITYRYLMDLVTMGEFQESTIARNDLYDIINDISKEW